ncbi:uncharacterized protein N7469_011140 [Penicillium citrinum]|uniref:Zn(2)-C6 fungal-type domain-containing protein n=1 Tax=Penicillium citrinum TaxID=5077 RepID=A0A9W9NCT9_PENCI|nr:uncharacterized protein N7469_011140 [Penicillium citrinum]KAJ5217515.1 hypothetical protein N7469_011140 [Penicillium citrinum]
MESASPIKPRRAVKACAFCRRRKLRCDNEKPTCSSCKSHGHECVYTTSNGTKRPTKARISRLEVENEQLRRQLEAMGSQPTAGPDSPTSSIAHGAQATPLQPSPESPISNFNEPSYTEKQDETNVDNPQSTVSRIYISANGDSSYHGLTSTLFDDAPTDRRGQTRAIDSHFPAEHVTKQLMGEAAYQRQMEDLNLSQGKLDFDGVDPELGMHLLSLHWNRQHHSFLITHRPSFMRDMATNGPYFSKLLLNAIYFGASKFSNRLEVRRDPDDVRTAGWTFRMRVKDLLGSALDRSDITTIQALLVMTSSLFALGDERSAAWLYAGTAFRMIIDLGMHVDATRLSNMRLISEEDLEIRRRVFWGAFVVDKIQSLYQGRPPSLQHFDTKVSLLFLDNYEELEHWKPFAYSDNQSYPGSPAYSVSTFTELCKLSLILNGILNKVYSEGSSGRSPNDLLATLNSLDTQLKEWHEALPEHLHFKNGAAQVTPPPHVLSLLALYNVLLILLHRPFVAEGHLHTADVSVAISSFNICTAAAFRIVKILQAYDQAFSIRRAPYLISYATYVAATILVRVAAQREDGSRAHAGLFICFDIFKRNQETNWAVRRAENVILHLMNRMGVDLNPQNTGRYPRSNDNDTNNSNQIEGIQSQWPCTSPRTPFSNQEISSGDADSSELDIDMIIQSFIRQDARITEGPVYNRFSNTSFSNSTLDSYDTNVAPTVAPTNKALLDAYADDDMLFGFNGSLQDSMFY